MESPFKERRGKNEKVLSLQNGDWIVAKYNTYVCFATPGGSRAFA
jgi:hypothetical protein